MLLLVALLPGVGILQPFCQAGDAILLPRVLADFKEGEAAMSVAPGEKRLARTWRAGHRLAYTNPPDSSYPGRRTSLKESITEDGKGGFMLVPQSDMTATVLGGMNLGRGTLAGWFRKGAIFRKGSGPLLSLKGYPLKETPWPFPRTIIPWQLGVESNGKGRVVYITTPHVKCISKRVLPPDEEWVHLAAVWDENHGARLYLNGEPAGAVWQQDAGEKSIPSAAAGSRRRSTMDNPLPADRLQIHADPQGALRDLQVFDIALSAAGVKALFRGEEPRREMTEASRINRPFRLASLGWAGAPDDAFLSLSPGRTRVLRQASVLEAKENLRAAGWLAVSGFVDEAFPCMYHGYTQGVDRELHLEFADAIKPDWIAGSGDFEGTIQTASGEAYPFRTQEPWFGKPIAPAARGAKLVLTQKKGSLSNLSFYEVSERGTDLPEGGRVYSLKETVGETLLPPWKEREFHSIYPPGNRLTFAAQTTPAAAATRKIPGLTAWHLVSPPMPEENALGQVGLRLRTVGLERATRARMVIHDAFSPWRELARLDFLLKPGGDHQDYTLLFDLRDTLVAQGNVVWITVTLEHDVTLLTGEGGSELVLFPAEDKEKALALWRDWELRSVRDRLELLSEQRPWHRVGEGEDSGWWLAVAMSNYEQIDRALKVLRERFPDDATIRAWYYFTRPKAKAPFADVPLPEAGGHPQWAVLAREALRLYRQFVDFWIDHRQHPNGELGNWYEDDTDLLQDWLDLTLISDPKGKYRRSLGRLAHGIATTYTLKGRPLLENGLNVRFTDTLHAYEEGLNIQPPDFITHYGDPVRFQRLLDTVSRYDGFLLTPESGGVRRFVSKGSGRGYLDTYRVASGSPDDPYWYLFLHAGMVAAWYNHDPEIWSMLEAIARSGSGKGAEALLQAMFLRTGDPGFLASCIDAQAWQTQRILSSPRDALYPNTYLRVEGMNRKGTLERMLQDAPSRYDSLQSTTMGWRDDRHTKNWLEWRLSGDEAYLIKGLEALVRQLLFLMPAYTTAEQSGDRVSIPKQLISQLYLGGVPGSRNRHHYPDFAVSYQGLNDNFAARVLENTPQSLRVELYSFEEQPLSGEMVVWSLQSGDYEITQGAKDDDALPVSRRQFLRRGVAFPVTIPSGTPWLVSIQQKSRSSEPAVLGDAALSGENIRWENGILHVPVYNLGVAPLKEVKVRLSSKEGRLLAEKTIETLPGVKEWKLGVVELGFEVSPEAEIHLEVNVSPEITEANNRAVFVFEKPG